MYMCDNIKSLFYQKISMKNSIFCYYVKSYKYRLEEADFSTKKKYFKRILNRQWNFLKNKKRGFQFFLTLRREIQYKKYATSTVTTSK